MKLEKMKLEKDECQNFVSKMITIRWKIDIPEMKFMICGVFYLEIILRILLYYILYHKWYIARQINNCTGKKYNTMNKLPLIAVSDRKQKIVPKKSLAILF